MLEHDIAMGYVSPAIPREKSMVERMNEAFPVPSPLHASSAGGLNTTRLPVLIALDPHLGFAHATNVSHFSYDRRRMLTISN